MKRVDKFYKSKRLYALDFSTFEELEYHNKYHENGVTREDPVARYRQNIKAIWFKKRNGRIAVCYGYIWDYSGEKRRKSAEDFALHASTGAYGGDPIFIWDGENVWGVENFEHIKELVKKLDPILKNYPNVPEGYDRWWEF